MERSAKWDNAKAVLIFLVVWAHYLGTGITYKEFTGGLWDVGTALYSFIYLFHMPMFAFISGYFSKNTEKARDRAFSDLLLPYLAFNFLFVLLDREPVSVLLAPYGPLWYLFALFLWRLMAKDLVRVKHSWLWAILFELLSSLFPPGNNYVAFSRAIGFAPFFLMGLCTAPEMVEKMKKLPRSLCALVLAAAFGGCLILTRRGISYQNIGFFIGQYALSRDSLKYVLADLLRYPVALVLSVCLFRLIPERHFPLTHIGKNTMTVFLLHSAPVLRNAMDLIFPLRENPAACLIYWTGWAVVMTLLLGGNMMAQWYSRSMAWLRRRIPKRSGEATAL